MSLPEKQIRAAYTETTIRVYQAYRPEIALAALDAGRFVPPFKLERMTWIKPSFLWMMYRCGWALKPGQEHVLALDITREGFEWALGHACLSSARKAGVPADQWSAHKAAHPVRVQWDPERDLHLQGLAHRSIQVGLSGPAVRRYVDEWIVDITDVTGLAKAVHHEVQAGRLDQARSMLPEERPYPASEPWRTALRLSD